MGIAIIIPTIAAIHASFLAGPPMPIMSVLPIMNETKRHIASLSVIRSFSTINLLSKYRSD